MKRWQYQGVIVKGEEITLHSDEGYSSPDPNDGDYLRELNLMGDAGWELVSVQKVPFKKKQALEYMFKKPVAS
jgi:hypothetical protein